MTHNSSSPLALQGILLLDKPHGVTSFHLVRLLRARLNIKKIGHAGTLDPAATGLMVMLVGRTFTRMSDQLLTQDKEYFAEIKLGESTDSYDTEGQILQTSDLVPSSKEIEETVALFQGTQQQIPPMFSAKKVKGKKLYELARQGIEIPRKPQTVQLSITILNYAFPFLTLKVNCSKGTYIRSLAYDIGMKLECYAHLHGLRRTQSGSFHVDTSISVPNLDKLTCDEIKDRFLHIIPGS